MRSLGEENNCIFFLKFKNVFWESRLVSSQLGILCEYEKVIVSRAQKEQLNTLCSAGVVFPLSPFSPCKFLGHEQVPEHPVPTQQAQIPSFC